MCLWKSCFANANRFSFSIPPFFLLFLGNYALKASYYSEDCISLLPDDILVSILSCLSLKEAVLSSCLSRRWWYLWTGITGLDFAADDELNKIVVDS